MREWPPPPNPNPSLDALPARFTTGPVNRPQFVPYTYKLPTINRNSSLINTSAFLPAPSSSININNLKKNTMPQESGFQTGNPRGSQARKPPIFRHVPKMTKTAFMWGSSDDINIQGSPLRFDSPLEPTEAGSSKQGVEAKGDAPAGSCIVVTPRVAKAKKLPTAAQLERARLKAERKVKREAESLAKRQAKEAELEAKRAARAARRAERNAEAARVSAERAAKRLAWKRHHSAETVAGTVTKTKKGWPRRVKFGSVECCGDVTEEETVATQPPAKRRRTILCQEKHLGSDGEELVGSCIVVEPRLEEDTQPQAKRPRTILCTDKHVVDGEEVEGTCIVVEPRIQDHAVVKTEAEEDATVGAQAVPENSSTVVEPARLPQAPPKRPRGRPRKNRNQII